MKKGQFNFLNYLKRSGAIVIREGNTTPIFWVGRYEFQKLFFEFSRVRGDELLAIFNDNFDNQEEEDATVYCGIPPQTEQFARDLLHHLREGSKLTDLFPSPILN